MAQHLGGCLLLSEDWGSMIGSNTEQRRGHCVQCESFSLLSDFYPYTSPGPALLTKRAPLDYSLKGDHHTITCLQHLPAHHVDGPSFRSASASVPNRPSTLVPRRSLSTVQLLHVHMLPRESHRPAQHGNLLVLLHSTLLYCAPFPHSFPVFSLLSLRKRSLYVFTRSRHQSSVCPPPWKLPVQLLPPSPCLFEARPSRAQGEPQNERDKDVVSSIVAVSQRS